MERPTDACPMCVKPISNEMGDTPSERAILPGCGAIAWYLALELAAGFMRPLPVGADTIRHVENEVSSRRHRTKDHGIWPALVPAIFLSANKIVRRNVEMWVAGVFGSRLMAAEEVAFQLSLACLCAVVVKRVIVRGS